MVRRPKRQRQQRPPRRRRILSRRQGVEHDPGLRRGLPRAAVPSFFTLMNLFCGFVAITQILEGNLEFACWLIVLAGFFDAIDGMTARLARAESGFGVELDSLSDIVSFGVAPGLLVYVIGLQEFQTLGLVVASLPAICGAVRLARYNVTIEDAKTGYFTGLPIPAQAATIVAIILNVNDQSWYLNLSPNNLSILVPIVVVLSGLMVSTIEFDTLPRPSANYIRQNPRKSIAYLVALVSIIIFQQIALLFVLVGYILVAIVRGLRDLSRTISGTETMRE